MLYVFSDLPVIPDSASSWIDFAIYAILAVLFVSVLKWEKKYLLKTAIRCVVAFLVYVLVYIIIRAIALPIDSATFPFINTLTAYLSYFIAPLVTNICACIFIHDQKRNARIINSSLLLTSWMLLPSVSMMILNNFFMMPLNLMSLPRYIIILVILIVLQFFNVNKFVKSDIWPLMIFESFIVIEIVIASIQNLNFNVTLLVDLSLWIWIVELFVYFFFYMFTKTSSEKNRQNIENQKLKNDIKMMNFMKTNYENMRILKHDMKNQYSYISMLYSQGKDEEAKKFFSEISLAADKTLNFASTGNRVLDMTLNMALEKAKENDVLFDYVCACPEETRFKDSDFFSLLINIFDNAVEAAAKCNDAKKVNVRIYVSANYLIIDTCNTFDPEVSGKTSGTSKADKKSHGYGRRIISSIASKYDGDIVTTTDGSTYEIKAMIALSEEEKEEKAHAAHES